MNLLKCPNIVCNVKKIKIETFIKNLTKDTTTFYHR